MTQDVERIAAGLSEAARKRLLGDDNTSCPVGVAVAFVMKGLIDPDPSDDDGWIWSPLGLAVKAHLEGRK